MLYTVHCRYCFTEQLKTIWMIAWEVTQRNIRFKNFEFQNENNLIPDLYAKIVIIKLLLLLTWHCDAPYKM